MRPDLLTVLSERVVVADGAMGTMLQAAGGPDGLSLDDFEGYEGCNEVLNATRPDVVKAVHAEYFAVGVDAVETNTFGCNLANLGEYDIADRIYELSESGARHAREVADDFSTPDQPRYVIGSIGPGTKLPTLGHAPYAALRDAFQSEVAGLLDGGADALLVETAQDLLQAKAALVGANRAMRAAGRKIPLIAQVTIEQTGTMLLGSEIGAALTALTPLGIDLIGLNCATGPAEMTEHLRHLAEYSQIPISCMPNAGLPVLGKDGAEYPLSPKELADAHDRFTVEYGLSLVGGCCGTTPEHLRQVVERVRGREVVRRSSTFEASASSLYSSVPFRQEASVLMVGERTNTNGSKAFREALLDSNWNNVIEIARDAARDGAHMSDVCVDYVGRDGAIDMNEVAGRYATASTLPIMLDSTEPAVIEAGLERLGGRCLINSVNFEDGDGPDSRWAKVLPIITEHGAAVVALTIDEKGQARTAEDKVAIAERLIGDLTTKWGLNEADIFVDTLTFTLGTGQEESRKDGEATINAIRELKRKHPDVQTILGLSNISFGLSPVSRVVLNSVFLHECQQAGLDAAIVHASKILPMSRIPDEQRDVALDMIYDRRGEDYDPLTAFLDLFAGVTSTADAKLSRAQELAALPLDERLQRRVIDGELNGLEADLDEALQERKALAIVNDTLLAGMKTVGELFGSGQMQLPFVLQSAQVMKTAVAHLEPHMEKSEDDEGKGTIVLATVKGDVHDIGKNLVDIIMSNNGYTVANIGIKQPVNAILDAAIEHKADVIGMSGLLVKSTVIMKENLVEMNTRGISTPVLLGGAALTRNYVEQDLAEIYSGRVRYARDAFEGLRLMDAVMAVKRGEQPEESLAPKARTRVRTERTEVAESEPGGRSDVAADIVVPTAPFFGDRLVRGIQTKEYVNYLDERATLLGRWGLRASKGGAGPSYEELVETEGRPRIRAWLDRIQSEQMLEAAVVYGYYRCVSKGEDLIVLSEEGQELTRFSFPRQRRDRRLCIADFFKAEDSGETDVIGFHMVTVGSKISGATAKLFEADAYRDYLELHGLSVQLAEALAEYWHSRIRAELGFGGDDNPDITEQIMHQAYRGSRYSFGYAACPDLEDRAKIAMLLKPERIGVTLSEEFQLHPEQSTDAIVVHHPEAKYFAAR